MKKARFIQKGQEGFSLPELMIAIAILAVVIVGLLSVFVSSLILNEQSRNLTIATTHAEYTLEHIRDVDFSYITTTNWTVWAAGAGLNTLPNESVVSSFSGTDPLDITITVSWTERGRTRNMELDTIITNAAE